MLIELLLAISFGLFLALLMWILFVRNEQVRCFRYRLIREEVELTNRLMWVDTSVTEEKLNSKDKTVMREVVSKLLSRWSSLPSYNQMMFQFWIPLSRWERSLSDFYGEYDI